MVNLSNNKQLFDVRKFLKSGQLYVILSWEDFSMETIKEFYGGTLMDINDADYFSKKGKVELKYYKIISNEMSRKNRHRKYGIEVVKKFSDKNIITEEKKEIFNCIEKEEVADKVLELLKVNKVSPINVVEILEDLSAKKKELLIK